MKCRCMGCMEEYEESFDVCPFCGYIKGTPPKEAYHLETGTILNGKYIVGKVLGFGGFGITYIGWNIALAQKIAIKEYLPSEFATRTPNQARLTVFSGDKEEQFIEGRNKFIDEAKRLAKFQSVKGIVQIQDSFVENETAYIVMEYLKGESLKQKLAREGKMNEEEVIEDILPILYALKEVHKEGIIHRDIAPDNIFITENETGEKEVKLLDFGAARFATSTNSKSLSVIIKAGYSAEEQYRSRGEQGPWSDIYSIAATMYTMLTGTVPQDSMERSVKDEVKLPSKYGVKISKNIENAIMNAMNIQIANRTQDAQTFIQELEAEQVKRRKEKSRKSDSGHWPIGIKITVAILAALSVVFVVLLATGVIDLKAGILGQKTLAQGTTRIPNIVNLEIEEATEKVTDCSLQLQINDKQYSDQIPENRILIQDLQAGEEYPIGEQLGVVVSAGVETVYVPQVTGYLSEYGIQLLNNLGLEYEISEEISEMAPGTVISQSIGADEQVAAGTKIALVVSIGRETEAKGTVEVPSFVGMDYELAQKEAKRLGLYVAIDSEIYDAKIPQNEVVSQKTDAGSYVDAGTVIKLTIVKGSEYIRVPDVQYKDEAVAVQSLENSKLVVLVNYESSDTVAKGKVIRQTIEKDSKVTAGTSITIIVSTGINSDNANSDNEWKTVTYLPSEVSSNKSNYEIETLMEIHYSYRDKVGTNSQSNAGNGWEFITSELVYDGDWSNWSRNALSASETMEVETRAGEDISTETTESTSNTMSGWTQTGSYLRWDDNWSGNQTSTSLPAGNERTEVQKISESSVTTYVYYHYDCQNGPVATSSGWYCYDSAKGTQNIYHEFSTTTALYNNPGGYYGGAGCSPTQACAYNFYSWWLKSSSTVTTYVYRTRDAVTVYTYSRNVSTPYTEYRSRNKHTVYYYWGDWTPNGTTELNGNNNRQVKKEEVITGYRYRKKA